MNDIFWFSCEYFSYLYTSTTFCGTITYKLNDDLILFDLYESKNLDKFL